MNCVCIIVSTLPSAPSSDDFNKNHLLSKTLTCQYHIPSTVQSAQQCTLFFYFDQNLFFFSSMQPIPWAKIYIDIDWIMANFFFRSETQYFGKKTNILSCSNCSQCTRLSIKTFFENWCWLFFLDNFKMGASFYQRSFRKIYHHVMWFTVPWPFHMLYLHLCERFMK